MPDISYFFYHLAGFPPDSFLSVIKTYGLFLFLAISVAVFIFEKKLIYLDKSNLLYRHDTNIKGLPPHFFSDMLTLCVVFGLLGAKIFALMDNYGNIKHENIFDVVFFDTGVSFLGGLIFAACACVVYFYKKKFILGSVLDASVPSLLIGYSLGRLGCHLSGDGCWGITVSDKPDWWIFPDWVWAYDFPHNVVQRGRIIHGCEFKYSHVLNEAVFPTSFYEFATYFFLFFLFNWLYRFCNGNGALFVLYLFTAGLFRFLIEFIRINVKYDVFGWSLSQAQIVSLTQIFIACLSLPVVFFCKI